MMLFLLLTLTIPAKSIVGTTALAALGGVAGAEGLYSVWLDNRPDIPIRK